MVSAQDGSGVAGVIVTPARFSGRWKTLICRSTVTVNGLGRERMRAGVAVLSMRIVPPLDRGTTWIELSAAGRSAQVRATLPLNCCGV